MKIIMAGQNYRITGGSDRVLLDEIDLLNENGHHAIPFAAAHPDNLKSPWNEYFPETADFNNPSIKDVGRYIYNPAAAKSIRKLIEDFKPDIVHCHIYYGKLTASIIAPVKTGKVPLVQTLHEYKALCPVYTLVSNGSICEKCSGFRFYNAALQKCNRGSLSRSVVSTVESYVSHALGSIRLFDHFIAVSDFLKNKAVEMGIPENKITTVHNYTDASQYVPNYEAGNYFVYFGRIEDIKGIWLLVAAFTKLHNLRIVMVGTGNAFQALVEHVERNQLKNIEILGFKTKTELGAIIKGCIATIAPSIWFETFGLTITESFSYGKPVIASRIGGITEVVRHEVDGLLVEPGNEDQLTAAIEYMASHRQQASAMGQAGRHNVETKFSRSGHYQKLLSVYETVKAQV